MFRDSGLGFWILGLGFRDQGLRASLRQVDVQI